MTTNNPSKSKLSEEGYLSDEKFLQLITLGSLISIDLIIRNSDNQILMGKRTNAPAKSEWFVPGGRIRKNEDIKVAFDRIVNMELGSEVAKSVLFSNARIVNVYTHIYNENFRNPKDKNKNNTENKPASTHYVVIAYELNDLQINDINSLPKEQHSEYKWWSINDAESSDEVNINNDPYFRNRGLIAERNPTHSEVWLLQYEAINNRRNSFNQLLWQTPSISLTAQAFLFTIIFSSDVLAKDKIITATIAFAVAFASIHLLYKHRKGEIEMAIHAERMEKAGGYPLLNHKFDSTNIFAKLPAYRVWSVLLALFGLTSLYVIMSQLLIHSNVLLQIRSFIY